MTNILLPIQSARAFTIVMILLLCVCRFRKPPLLQSWRRLVAEKVGRGRSTVLYFLDDLKQEYSKNEVLRRFFWKKPSQFESELKSMFFCQTYFSMRFTPSYTQGCSSRRPLHPRQPILPHHQMPRAFQNTFQMGLGTAWSAKEIFYPWSISIKIYEEPKMNRNNLNREESGMNWDQNIRKHDKWWTPRNPHCSIIIEIGIRWIFSTGNLQAGSVCP